MNLLTQKPPEVVTVSGKDYPIHTDFRIWIGFELVMVDGSMPEEEKLFTILKPYREDLPPTLDEAVRALVDFYAGGNKSEGDSGSSDRSPIYSFSHDGDYIYAAFLQQYGINLQTADLHWYAFKALFKSLNDTTRIVKMMEFRSVNLAEIKDKEQKKYYRKMKRLYRLPDMRSEEEKEQAMIRSLAGLF